MRVLWSRRRFVAQGLLPMAAAAPVFARSVVGPLIESPPGTQKRTGSGAVRSAGSSDNRLTTIVTINGRGPYHFLVDTGAERTLIAGEIAKELALPQGPKVLIEGIIGRTPAVLVEIARLRLGNLICPSLQVPVLPRSMLGVDGYLGLDVLDRHRVVLDFRARELTVGRPKGFFSALWERFDETVVHTLGSSGRLRSTNCLVNGVRASAFIDTGAEVSVSNPALYAALQQRAKNHQLVGGPVELAGVTGGSLSGMAIGVDEIRLGALTWTYAPLVVANLEVFNIWGLSHEPALLFGMDCLRRFARVSIDYGRKELSFELARARPVLPLEAGLPPPVAG